MKVSKEEALKKWRQLVEHKKAMEEKFRMYETTNIYAQFG